MKGTITKSEQEYQVQVDEGAMVKLRKSQVHFVGKEIRDLYLHLKKSYVRQGTGEHIQLARWCIDNGLLDEAGEHYRFLKDRIPGHPQLRTIEVQLKDKLLEDPLTRIAVGLPAEKPKDDRRIEGEHVQLASTTAGHSSEALGKGNSKADHSVAGSEIASPVVAMNFREHVLPVFRNRCGQAGCHGNQSKTDLVFQPSHTQMFASSQKSLLATLKYIDLKQPSDSVLIKKATTPHGTQRKPPFDLGSSDDARVFQVIQDWIQLVASEKNGSNLLGSSAMADRPNVGPAYASSNSAAVRPGSTTKAASTTLTAREAANPYQSLPEAEANAAMGVSGLGNGVDGPELDQLEGLIRKLEEVEKRKMSSDPFDPNRFNQRFAEPKNAGDSRVAGSSTDGQNPTRASDGKAAVRK